MGKVDIIIRLFKEVIKPTLKIGMIGAGGYCVYKLADKAIDKGYRINVGGSYNMDTKTISANAALDLLKASESDSIGGKKSMEQPSEITNKRLPKKDKE